MGLLWSRFGEGGPASGGTALGYARAVSRAMLIYEKGSQENALPLTAFLCRL